MLKQIPLTKIIVLWIAWLIITIGFQHLVTNRFTLKRPDRVVMWTESETTARSQNDKPTLIDPFLNQLVSWDSEFYLSIALNGYDDPAVRTVDSDDRSYALNYAFFPLYPFLIRQIAKPLAIFDLTPIATATLAGVCVSLLATLVAMISIYDLGRDSLEKDGAMRTAFYLIIFPTGFFLAQVYTEALFLALSFASLALMRRKQYVIAAILSGLAVITRAVGIALIAAMLVQLVVDAVKAQGGWRPLPLKAVGKSVLLGLIPAGAYLLWRSRLGVGFDIVQERFFGSTPFNLIEATQAWLEVLPSVWGETTSWTGSSEQTAIYFALEFSFIILALLACVGMARALPAAATFSLMAWSIAFFNGSPHSMVRYVMVMPVIYLWLARLGNRPNFDRIWTMISLLLFAVLATLFSFDFWVA